MGEEQADLYLAQLNAAVGDENLRRVRARPIDFVQPGWFRMREVRHFIYFRLTGDDVVVMRVLHDSMDETLHLP
jgi:plasmid stabilization system protein ParE